MKAEINNENKAKFFALYWGQEVMKGVWKNAQHSPLKITFDTIGQCHNYRLELKPLSLISDEDAEYIDLQSEDYNEDGWFDDDQGMFYYWASIDIDYLRSKGYALPWMGLSVEEMVEAGWIKLVES